jgi:hypothetical protein
MLRGGRPIATYGTKQFDIKMVFINFSGGQRPSQSDLFIVKSGGEFLRCGRDVGAQRPTITTASDDV